MNKYIIAGIIVVFLFGCSIVPVDREHVLILPKTYIHYCQPGHSELSNCDGKAIIHGYNGVVTETHIYFWGMEIDGKLFPESQEVFGHELLHILQHVYGTHNPDE